MRPLFAGSKYDPVRLPGHGQATQHPRLHGVRQRAIVAVWFALPTRDHRLAWRQAEEFVSRAEGGGHARESTRRKRLMRVIATYER